MTKQNLAVTVLTQDLVLGPPFYFQRLDRSPMACPLKLALIIIDCDHIDDITSHHELPQKPHWPWY